MTQLTAVAHLRDLRHHLRLLESAGKLVRITRPINKDTPRSGARVTIEELRAFREGRGSRDSSCRSGSR